MCLCVLINFFSGEVYSNVQQNSGGVFRQRFGRYSRQIRPKSLHIRIYGLLPSSVLLPDIREVLDCDEIPQLLWYCIVWTVSGGVGAHFKSHFETKEGLRVNIEKE